MSMHIIRWIEEYLHLELEMLVSPDFKANPSDYCDRLSSQSAINAFPLYASKALSGGNDSIHHCNQTLFPIRP